MTVSNNYAPVIAAANGVTTVFSGPWNAIAAANLVVQLLNTTTGVYTLISQGSGSNQYQVTTLTNTGWVITFNTAPVSGNNVVISRDTAQTQTIPYTTSRGFQGVVEEGSFDALTAMVQEINDANNRSLTFGIGFTGVGILPNPIDGAVLMWSGTNGTVVNGPNASQISSAAGYAAAADASAELAASYAAGIAVQPIVPQLHQNGGGSNNGPFLCFANQNFDLQIDHIAVFSYDNSLIFNYIIGGTPTTGDIVGFDFTLNSVAFPIRYTVPVSATESTIAAGIAAAMVANTALNNALADFQDSDGYGYLHRAYSSGTSVIFNYPWAASGNNVAPFLGGGATETITINNSAMDFPDGQLDNGPYFSLGKYNAGRAPVVGDLGGSLFFVGQSGASTNLDSTIGVVRTEIVATGPIKVAVAIGGSVQSGTSPMNFIPGMRFCEGAYGSNGDGSGNPCIGGDMGYGTQNVDKNYYIGGISTRAIYADNDMSLLNNAAGVTLTSPNVTLYGLLRSGAAGVTDTTPTAVAIVSALNSVNLGTIWNWLLINSNSGTLLLSPGSGVTFKGNLSTGNFSIAAGTQRNFVVRVDNAVLGSEAVSFYG